MRVSHDVRVHCAMVWMKSLNTSLSVAMCTFNGGRFLSAQLASIAAQDRPPDELLVCDDGSSDGSLEIVKKFAQRSAFYTRLVANDRNLGSTKNFEKAISLCQGAIVALADQDDIWYRHKLGRLEKAFLRSSEIVLAFSDADMIDDDSQSLGARLWTSFSFGRAEQLQVANGNAVSVLLRHPVVTGASMAFRREYLDLMVPIPPKQIHDRWISFLLAARGKFEAISDPLMQYRQHQGQQVGPGPRTLRERRQWARRTSAEFYLGEVERFHEFCDWVDKYRSNFPHAEWILNEIQRKISHLEHRAQLPTSPVARIPRVLRRALNGDYWRYSAGWNSIAKDLVRLT
jgi:glycosyltransferase involved in cell wall biosynthesis